MIAYHTTLLRHTDSIEEHGLLVERSVCARPAIWLHNESRIPWGFSHVLKRHRAAPHEIVVYEVDVPRSWLKPAGRGVWYTTRDISPERLVSRVSYHAVVSPLVFDTEDN